MKLTTCSMDKMEKSEISNTPVQVVPSNSRLRPLAIAVCGLILGIIAVGVVVSILIYGNTRTTKDVTFHIAHTGEAIKENIVITDTEEIIKWLVTKLSDTGVNVCFISEFKLKNSINIERECLKKIKTDVHVKEENLISIHYKSTDKAVDEDMLSPTAARMCQHSYLIWFTDVTNDTAGHLVKRSDKDKDKYDVILSDGTRGSVNYQESLFKTRAFLVKKVSLRKWPELFISKQQEFRLTPFGCCR